LKVANVLFTDPGTGTFKLHEYRVTLFGKTFGRYKIRPFRGGGFMTISDTLVAPAQFGMGRVIARTFNVFGQNFLPFLLLATVAVAPTMLISWLWIKPFVAGVRGPAAAALFLSNLPIMIGTIIISVIFTYLLQAALVQATVTTLNGRPASLGECIATALSSLLPLIAIGVLATFCVALGMIVLIVPGIIIAIALSVVVPVRVVERAPILDCLSRSVVLTRGHRWAIFGIFLIFALANGAADLVIRPLSGLGLIATAHLSSSAFTIFWIASTVLRIFTAAIGAVGIASIYYELRLIKDGVGPQELAAVFA